MATLAELVTERKKLDEQIAAEVERTQEMTKEQILAEMLHSKCCRLDHTDQCGWEYEDDWTGWTHQQWLKKADLVLKTWKTTNITDPDFADKVVNLIANCSRL